MDYLTLILSALTAGSKLLAEGAVGEAGSQAYQKLTTALKKVFTGKKSAEVALQEYPKDPEVWKQPLIKALKEANIAANAQIIDLARLVLDKTGTKYTIQTIGPTAIIDGDVTGGTIFVGDFKGSIYQGPAPADTSEAVRLYRTMILKSCRYLPRGIDVGMSDPTCEQKQISLSGIYIHLNTTTTVAPEGRKGARRLPQRAVLSEEETEMRALTAIEAAAQNPRLVLLGDPGSGKSTFLGYIAHSLSAAGLGIEAAGDLAEVGWPRDALDILPIQVLLRDFAESYKASDAKAEPRHLWDFIAGTLKSNNLSEAEAPLRMALETGKSIVLLDGLDEIPSVEQRLFVRDAVSAFANRYDGCRFIVTCRILSYQDRAWQIPRFPALTLAPFSEEQVLQFVGAWYDELLRIGMVKDREEADTLSAKLREAVRRPDMWRLAPNPLLLTVMALVHTHQGRLPEARAKLYEETIDILLWRWEQQKSGERGSSRLKQLLSDAGRSDIDLKRVLGQLAYESHQKGGATDDPEALADIDESRLERALAALNSDDHGWAQEIIEGMKLRAGLLIERRPGTFTFPHRTFQEYLAGAHLSVHGDFAKQAAGLLPQLGLWREVILLAVGRQTYVTGDSDKPLALVGSLCPEGEPMDELDWKAAWLAGDVLLEMGTNRVKDSPLGHDLLRRVRQRLAALVSGGRLTPVERAAAGDTLARLGDRRPGVGVLAAKEVPDILWCRIPTGTVLMGSDSKRDRDAFDDEKAQHPLSLPEFYISRYPVTNAHLRVFLASGGYSEPRYWPEAEKAGLWKGGTIKGRYDDSPRSGPAEYGEYSDYANHPVVGITWYEALAFCRWLDERMKLGREGPSINVWVEGKVVQTSLPPNEWCITLPSEAQWEKAARGGDGRRFPWGDEDADANRANFEETGIGHTSAVGCFPAGASPYGILDMSGNVWEWTRSLWGKDWDKPHFRYPYEAGDGREDLGAGDDVLRVLRGGACDYVSRDLRCAYRYRYDPALRYRLLGFRVVLSPV